MVVLVVLASIQFGTQLVATTMGVVSTLGGKGLGSLVDGMGVIGVFNPQDNEF